MRLSISAILFAALSGACVASGGMGVQAQVVAPMPTAEIVVAPAPVAVVEEPQPVVVEEAYVAPDLVEVSPGVQVIADYNEPVFFSSGLYWRNDGGVWYSSSVHTGGWARGEAPEHIRTISRPTEYAHYRPAGYVPREQRPGYRPPARVEPNHQVGHTEPGHTNTYQPARTEPAHTNTYQPAHTEPTHPATYQPTHVEPAKPTYQPTHVEPAKPTNYQPTHAVPTQTVQPTHSAPAAPPATYHAPPPAAKPAAPSVTHPAPTKYVPPKKK
jgi:hypothetical protein